jgi:hypothetical protein
MNYILEPNLIDVGDGGGKKTHELHHFTSSVK